MRRPFSPWVDCVIWLFTGWLAGVAVTVAGLALERAFSPGAGLRFFFRVAPNVGGAAAVLFFGLSASRARPGVVLSLRPPPWRALPFVVLSALSLSLLAAGLNTWIDRVLPMPPEVETLFQEVLEYHTLPQLLGVLSFLVIVAPVTEELMFRGLFLHRLAEGYGHWPAILGSAFCFGVFHILPWQAVGATLVGVYLGWLVVRTGSILMPMAAHALFNLVPVAATGLSEKLPALRGLGAGPESEEFRFSTALLAAVLLALAAGIAGTVRLTRGAARPARPAPLPESPSPDSAPLS